MISLLAEVMQRRFPPFDFGFSNLLATLKTLTSPFDQSSVNSYPAF